MEPGLGDPGDGRGGDLVMSAVLDEERLHPAMAFKLIKSAEQRWRAVNGPHLVALVRAGAVVRKGVIVENRTTEDQIAA